MAATFLNPPSSYLFPTESYHPMLTESVHHYLSQLQDGISDNTHFNLMFSRLIQTMPSPPIEVLWFYTAVNFHSIYKNISTHKNITAQDDKLGMVLALKELFQLLVSSSNRCISSFKRVAVLAPLVFELYNLVYELKSQSGLRLDRVIDREIGCLVEGLVSFISLCCKDMDDDHDESLAFSPCFVDLVKVWTARRRGRDFGFEDDFRIFFPIIGDKVRNELWVGSGVGVLAGVVMCQAFLLNLCLKFDLGNSPKAVEQELLNSAVNTITVFRSCYFFDTLLKVLLESSLPVTSLLTPVEEFRLREVLFDAIILVDYPFFNPGCGIRFCSHHLNSLASMWLFVADKAMQFVRYNADQAKAITYAKVFSKSLIRSQLLRWVSHQTGMVEDNKPNLSTPADFLEWLVQLRNQTLRTFDNDFSILLEKAMCYKLEMKSELPFSKVNDNDKDFEVDPRVGEEGGVQGDSEMTDSDLSSADVYRKRKQGGKDEGAGRVKQLKYHIHDSPMKNFLPFRSDVGLIRRN